MPGAAVSPGTRNCNFTNAPALTVTEAALAVLPGSETSLAVTVRVPEVLSVTVKVCEPATSAALSGSTAFASEDVMPTMSVALVIKFQFVSTALTVTVNDVAAVWTAGGPDFA